MLKRNIQVLEHGDFWIIIQYTQPDGEIFKCKFGGFKFNDCMKKFKKAYNESKRHKGV